MYLDLPVFRRDVCRGWFWTRYIYYNYYTVRVEIISKSTLHYTVNKKIFLRQKRIYSEIIAIESGECS